MNIMILMLAMITHSLSATLNLASNSISPTYARSTATVYSFTFTALTAFTQDFYIQIAFPSSQFSITQPTACSFKVNSINKASAVCAKDNDNIKFTSLGITESISSITIQFTTSGALYSGNAILTFTYINPLTNSPLSMINYVSITYTNAVMGCSLTSASNTVGAETTYTFSYTPLVPIAASSILQMNLEPWGAYKQSNFITTSPALICGSLCSITTPSSNNNISQTIRYASSIYPSQTSTPNPLALSKARNPASTKSITFSATLTILIGSSERTYQTCSTTIQVSTPNSFQLLNFPTNNRGISATNIITLRLTPQNPISPSTFLRINPSGLSLGFTYNLYNINARPSQTTTSDGTLLLGNLTTSTTTKPISLTLNNFTLQNPPYANKAVTLTFLTFNLVSDVEYSIDTGTISISATASTITQAGLSVAASTINTLTTYTIWFKTINQLSVSSMIVYNLPSQISLSSATCSSSSFASQTCTISGQTVTITTNNIVASGTNVSLSINNARNPPTTTQTSTSASITTYYESLDTLVDQLPNTNSLLKVTATPTTLKSVILTPASMTVGSSTSYTLQVQVNNQLPSNSYMTIKLPSASYSLSTISLSSFTTSTTISACTMTTLSSPLYLQFNTNCFPSSVPASSTIKIVLNNIENPISTKPTQSWEIEAFYNGKLMEYLRSGITATMSTPTQLTFAKVTPTSAIANENTVYQFQFTFKYAHYTGDRIIIVFPSNIILGPNPQCLPISPAGMTLTCQSTNSVTLEVIINISGTSSSNTNSLKMSVSDITNNWYASTSSITLKTTTNDSTYYYMETYSATVNFQPSTLIATAANNQQIILLGQSTISITIQSPFVLSRASGTYNLLLLSVTVPSDLTPITGTCSLSITDAVCTQSTSQKYEITNFNDFSTELVLTFSADTKFFTQTSVFTIRLTYDGSQVATLNTLKVLSYCISPCKQCTAASKNQCLSCLPSPHTTNNTLFPENSTCLTVCPDKYFQSEDGIQCSACNQSACFSCIDNANKCISCQAGKYLLNEKCESVCPQFYYPNVIEDDANSGQCLACQPPCLTCTSNTICLTCIEDYFLDIDSSCVRECSDVSYLGVDGICKLCTNNCKSCEGTLSNCTSCQQSQYLLLGNECVRACPSGFFNNINSSCIQCIPPCATCSSATDCDSCVSGLYLYDNQTCTSDCPPGTLEVINTCKNCSEQCATCQGTLQNCTSCPSGLYYYQNGCIEQCPDLMYEYNKTCTFCIFPCATCTGSPSSCLSCENNMFLLDQGCVNSCPVNGYYVQQQDKQCLPCTQNCLYCQSLTKCDTCAESFYLLDGRCVSSCPDSNPIIENRQCKDCDPQCATCSGSPDNCTKCTVFYFKYQYTCVQQCPVSFYSNVVTYQCQDGLTSRIVFFPIFITGLVILAIVIISRCISPPTSFITALTSLLAPLQLAIWIFMLVLLTQEIKQPDVNYSIPNAVLIIAVVCFFITNIIFFIVNRKRMEQDETAVQWNSNNINYLVCRIVQIVAIIVGFKFFRLVYSRLFNSIPLSLAYKHRFNVFTISTVFVILQLVLCQVLAVVGFFYLVYNKSLKDQIFYSAIEGLLVTIFIALVSLIDIYKAEEYFEESQFQKMKKYVEKVKDSSFNKLEEGFEISQEEGSIDAERFVSTSGGKFIYSKRDPDKLFFEDESRSEITDAHQQKTRRKINIFDPIKEEEAQYYQGQKFKDSQVHTQAKLQERKRKLKAVSIESDEEADIHSQTQRKVELGLQENEKFDDQKSLLGDRSRKKKWNDLMDERKKKANKIFNKNTIDLAQIDEPLMEEEGESDGENSPIDHDYEGQGQEREMQNNNGQEHRLRRRRRKKKGDKKIVGGNKQLQGIYLQRLTERKRKAMKDAFNSDKAIKYDF